MNETKNQENERLKKELFRNVRKSAPAARYDVLSDCNVVLPGHYVYLCVPSASCKLH